MTAHRFESTLDLARLPYFEIRDGRLAVADPGLRTIDVHTHLALSFVRNGALDLVHGTGPTQHYLPVERPLDLDVYINRNFSAGDLVRLKKDLSVACLTAGGMRATHTVDNLTREMADLGITHSVLLAIDFPAPLSRNTEAYLEAARGREELIVFGSVHPFEVDADRVLDRQVAAGIRGLKVHPAVQVVSPENTEALRLYRHCGRHGLPVLWHCGPVDIELPLGRRLSQVRLYRRAIEQTPEVTFILGHSGALQMERALEFAREFPNVWLELSSQSITNVRRILDEAPIDRVTMGSDWPFYHQAIPLAKILLATEDRLEIRSRVLWDNAARLLGLAPAVREPELEECGTR